MNKIVAIGRMVDDAEMFTTKSGYNYCTFRIAIDKNYQKSGEEKKTSFVECKAWRDAANRIVSNYSKGSELLLVGELEHSEFIRNGKKEWIPWIIVDEVFSPNDRDAREAAIQNVKRELSKH